jgi:hypothetical protein
MLTVFADNACRDETRIPLAEHQELIMQMNCNLYCSEDAEVYFAEPEEFAGLTILSESEFIETFVF